MEIGKIFDLAERVGVEVNHVVIIAEVIEHFPMEYDLLRIAFHVKKVLGSQNISVSDYLLIGALVGFRNAADTKSKAQINNYQLCQRQN